jgi:Erv1 / Alr family
MPINPTAWGPGYWEVIHGVAFWFPAEPTPGEKKSAYDFFTSLSDLLPCAACRDHWREILRVHPLENAVNSRMDLLKWSIDVHNAVNVASGKTALSYEKSISLIEKLNAKQTKPSAVAQNAMPLIAGVVIGWLLATAAAAAARRERPTQSGVELKKLYFGK